MATKNLLKMMMSKISKKTKIKEPSSIKFSSLPKTKGIKSSVSKNKSKVSKKSKILKSTIGSVISFKNKNGKIS